MEAYILQLLHDAGTPDNLDPQTHDRLVQDLTSRAAQLINRRLLESLSEDDARELDRLTDEQPDNAQLVQTFIEAHVPNSQQVITQALVEFRELYLGNHA
jgi:hypothetical protein